MCILFTMSHIDFVFKWIKRLYLFHLNTHFMVIYKTFVFYVGNINFPFKCFVIVENIHYFQFYINLFVYNQRYLPVYHGWYYHFQWPWLVNVLGFRFVPVRAVTHERKRKTWNKFYLSTKDNIISCDLELRLHPT